MAIIKIKSAAEKYAKLGKPHVMFHDCKRLQDKMLEFVNGVLIMLL